MVLGDVDSEDLPVVSDEQERRDALLSALYEGPRAGGIGRTAPQITRWLAAIRTEFPALTARLLQADAAQRLDLSVVLSDDALADSLEPDVALAAQLIALARDLPPASHERARAVIRRVVDELAATWVGPIRERARQAVTRRKTTRPTGAEVDWSATIHKNLRHYDPKRGVLVPERWVGTTRSRSRLEHLFLCVDQSGSMSESMVYAAIAASALGQVPSVHTELYAFDSRVVCLTEAMHDPVATLFGAQLGGGTDIGLALSTVSAAISEPLRSTVVLISDLFDGPHGSRAEAAVRELLSRGVHVICLLAVSERGTPAYDERVAASLRGLGVVCRGTLPSALPEVLASALNRSELR